MAVNIALGFVFLASVVALWYRVSLRLPELIAIPEEVMRERIARGDTRLSRWAMTARRVWEERHLQKFARSLGAKALQKLHIVLMRFDNGIVGLMRKIRWENGLTSGESYAAEKESSLSPAEVLSEKKMETHLQPRKSRALAAEPESLPTIKTVQFSAMRTSAVEMPTHRQETLAVLPGVRKRMSAKRNVQRRPRRAGKIHSVEESNLSPT